ncbi:family 16 glycosylhydrolase [Phenylobacterium sp. VNQ135]|uniref:family 16 glycosylhydrolase n=1 Tax=Phenylobacterium sp. VNQ135 TaxID=3400922 RepID=UPI003BFF8121
MSYRKYDGSAAVQTTAPVSDKFGTDLVETLTGTSAHESLWLGERDTGVGGAGDDTYYLQGHNTTLVEAAGAGVDKIVAWSNVDLSKYSNIENVSVGNDGTYAAGNAFDNVVEGQAGAQQLYGGKGQDVLVGGAGRDVFVVVKGEDNDVIQDFSVADDKLRLKAGLTSFDQVKARMTQDGADVKLDLGDGDGLIFRNITIDQFQASNFQLELNHATLGAQTFGDDFSGPLSLWDAQSNPTGTWRPDFGYQGEQGTGSYTLMSNNEKQIYTSPYFRGHNGDFSESPFVTNPDGTLSIVARPSANGEIFGYGYTSGMITTKESFSQTYGYFEMRADIPDAVGAWPAFWLIPADGSWPPELDIMETLTYDPNALWTTEHSGLGEGGHSSNGQLSYVPDTADGMHTYGALWSATEIVWYVDNVEVFRTATPADMNKPMFMIANLALGGWGGAIDGADLPAEFKIDYIRAYSLGGGTGQPLVTPGPVAAPVPAPVGTANPVPVGGVSQTAGDGGQALEGTVGGDTLMGGAGGDSMNGGAGQDFMRGGGGNDVMSGGDAFDDMHGNLGDDVMAGNDGGDWVVGGQGSDRLYGDEGDDVVLGNLGDDVVDGGAGADVVRGGQGDDQLFGWGGDDWLSGDRGSDTISGGSGADTFHSFSEAGVDVVTDFNFAEGDRVSLLAGTQYSYAQVGADVVIDMGAGASLTLQNVQLSGLGEGWIVG